ncbi:hypothetical protein [Sutcliffiella sp. BMC8]|uniref:hypothetical protein n=1 Tax=Sutcliffiella sp. BMC8 TaxID=3073243 RepID=UPI0030CEAD3F
MKEEKALIIEDQEIVVIITQPKSGLFRAGAFYKNYPDRITAFHESNYRDIASEEAVRKLLSDCPPGTIEYI